MSLVGSLGIFFQVTSGAWACMVCWDDYGENLQLPVIA